MFTGLVQEVGRIQEISTSPEGRIFNISCSFEHIQLGESIAVSGACLTVSHITGGGFRCDASAETLDRTTLRYATAGSEVHLERALQIGARVGGHLVSGHVDGVGSIYAVQPLGDALQVTVEVPSELAPFLASKGSIAIDGISLTINRVRDRTFDVVLVPYSRAETRLDRKKPGSEVNIEVDILAKYVARLLGKPGVDGMGSGGTEAQGVTLDLLGRQGYL
ncbi:MAG: riboflavin synthase [Myxococcota bacterium]